MVTLVGGAVVGLNGIDKDVMAWLDEVSGAVVVEGAIVVLLGRECADCIVVAIEVVSMTGAMVLLPNEV